MTFWENFLVFTIFTVCVLLGFLVAFGIVEVSKWIAEWAWDSIRNSSWYRRREFERELFARRKRKAEWWKHLD